MITTSPVPLERVAKISRFRSGVGHDYSDGVERCRSMKHYLKFVGGEPGEAHDPSWTTVPIVSPLAGTVVSVQAEWAGDQIRIRSTVDARYTAVLFHVRRAVGVDGDVAVDVGSVLASGQAIGSHASDETMSDLAVEFDDPATPQGRRLVSAFDGGVMGDAAFAAFAARGGAGGGAGGRADRAALIIGREERDADPLTCDGEAFAGEGRIANWVVLAAPGGTASPQSRWRSVLPLLAVDGGRARR
ncbi:MAG: hypothetical protein ABI780_14010 [Ardenticatenales bacterium]